MPKSFCHACFSIVLLTLGIAACGMRERCGVPTGVAVSCQCSNGAAGARSCQPDNLWGPCDCSGNIALPAPVLDGEPSAGSGGSMSVTGGRVGSGGAVVSGGGVIADEDAGMEPVNGADGSVSGGATGGGGVVGSGGMIDAGMAADPYRSCSSASDCDSGGQCTITANFPSNASVCAPACVDVGDCPVPSGTYEAAVTCDVGYCRLNCTPVLFAALLTCPANMTCIAPLLGTAYCHSSMP